MTLYIMITVVLALSGLTMTALTAIYYRTSVEKLRTAKPRPQGDAKFFANAAFTSVLSMGLVYLLTWSLYPFLYDEGSASVLRIIGEGVAILLLYDFFYYLTHRYLFHEWKILRRVHAVHHVVKAPSAVDSLYLHPIECIMGLALLWACTFLLTLVTGPVSIYSFAWAFCVYSLMNVIIHSGLILPAFPFAPINYMTKRHQGHHVGMKSTNYASVTPLFDMLFRSEIKAK